MVDLVQLHAAIGRIGCQRTEQSAEHVTDVRGVLVLSDRQPAFYSSIDMFRSCHNFAFSVKPSSMAACRD